MDIFEEKFLTGGVICICVRGKEVRFELQFKPLQQGIIAEPVLEGVAFTSFAHVMSESDSLLDESIDIYAGKNPILNKMKTGQVLNLLDCMNRDEAGVHMMQSTFKVRGTFSIPNKKQREGCSESIFINNTLERILDYFKRSHPTIQFVSKQLKREVIQAISFDELKEINSKIVNQGRAQVAEHEMIFMDEFQRFVGVSPFSNSSVPMNMLMAFGAGSGGTLVQNAIKVNHLQSNGKLVVIEEFQESENLCRMLGGAFFDINYGSKLNPFPLFQSMKDEEATILMSVDFIELLCGVKNIKYKDHIELTEIVSTIVSCGKKITLKRVYKKLTSKMLKQMLYQYVRGKYKGLFDGGCDINFVNDFTVITVERLRSEPELKKLLTYLITKMAFVSMSESEQDQPLRRKMIFTDEVWSLWGDDYAEQYESMFRCSRLRNISMVANTIGVEDILKNKVLAALNNTCVFKLMGVQKVPEDDSRVKSLEKVGFSVERLEAIKGLKKRRLDFPSINHIPVVLFDDGCFNPLSANLHLVNDPYTSALCRHKNVALPGRHNLFSSPLDYDTYLKLVAHEKDEIYNNKRRRANEKIIG